MPTIVNVGRYLVFNPNISRDDLIDVVKKSIPNKMGTWYIERGNDDCLYVGSRSLYPYRNFAVIIPNNDSNLYTKVVAETYLWEPRGEYYCIGYLDSVWSDSLDSFCSMLKINVDVTVDIIDA